MTSQRHPLDDLPEDLRRELLRFVDVLEAEWGDALVSVVVFGSYVTGKARPESDLDVLLVKADLPRSRLARRHLVYPLKKRAGETFAATACTIILTPEEAQIVKPYYLGMLDGHVILFDRQRFFARILERLKKRLEELGAERRTDPDGYTYWVLKKDARPGEPIIL
ncbi:MAG: nucleotidyltransferase domain-containing protein [Acidobacteria bacterium]|nr:MAG: nucleotidyltransferase domain-containing protein [Acidobacteriota bacterium]